MKTTTTAIAFGIVLSAFSVNAQNVGIKTNDPKSILDVSGTDGGVLVPRMSTTARQALSVGTDQDGMQIFDTDTQSLWYYNSGAGTWMELKYISNKFVDGPTSTDAVDTTRNRNFGIGTDSPTEKLHVVGNILSEDSLASEQLMITDPAAVHVLATGGNTVTALGNDRIHIFTSSGTFTPNDITNIEYLVVGGGGASGRIEAAGGGGGGGFVTGTATIGSSPIAITVGAGGNNTNPDGESSSIAGVATAAGGGRGAGDEVTVGGSGASGGGGSYYYSVPPSGSPIATLGGNGIAGQGNAGGDGLSGPLPTSHTAGGGGAGAAGGDATVDGGGNGGDGRSSDITGTTQWYGGGGAGGNGNFSTIRSSPGLGGGGNGRHAPVAGGGAQNGAPNTGGGAGANGYGTRRFGGSGIVVIRYTVPTTTTEPEIIATDGANVGIGTPDPTTRLSVNGDANKTGGGSWAVFSDERSKENITEYTKGTEELLEIKPVSFQYKEEMDWGTDTHVGVIAQELEEVVPSMVTTKEVKNIKDFKEVDPNELNYMLINAVKELQAKTNELKAAIDRAEQNTDASIEELKAQAKEVKRLEKLLQKYGINTKGSVAHTTEK